MNRVFKKICIMHMLCTGTDIDCVATENFPLTRVRWTITVFYYYLIFTIIIAGGEEEEEGGGGEHEEGGASV